MKTRKEKLIGQKIVQMEKIAREIKSMDLDESTKRELIELFISPIVTEVVTMEMKG